MNPRSTERDLLRDYAREQLKLVVEEQIGAVRVQFVQLGEVSGKTFMALQNVLSLIEKAEGMDVQRVDVSGLRDAIRKGLS